MADIIARPEDHLQKFKTYGDEEDGSSGVIPYVEAEVTVGDITVDNVVVTSGSISVTNVVEVDATGQGDVPITLDSEVVAVDATGQGDVPITLDSEVVDVDATGQGDVPITLGGEVVDVDATGQGDVPITLDSEVVAVDATGQGDVPVAVSSGSLVITSGDVTVGGEVAISATPAVTVQRAAISSSGSGNNTLVVAGTDKLKVLGMILVAGGDVDVRLESGADGTALTGVISLAADGNGFVLPVTPIGYHWLETAAATLLNLELSSAVQVSGALVYHEEA